MSSSKKYAVAPPATQGLQVFVRSSYTAKYNFAVANYNAVSVSHKKPMRDGFVGLYRSVVAVVGIICLVFAILALFKGALVIVTVIFSSLYIALSLYNAYVFFDNRSLLNAARLLRAKFAGPTGADYEWVSVPLDSRSANERLAAVDQSALDNVRKEFTGSDKSELDCMVYTQRYADTYPSFPKELLIYIVGFLGIMTLGIALAIL